MDIYMYLIIKIILCADESFGWNQDVLWASAPCSKGTFMIEFLLSLISWFIERDQVLSHCIGWSFTKGWMFQALGLLMTCYPPPPSFTPFYLRVCPSITTISSYIGWKISHYCNHYSVVSERCHLSKVWLFSFDSFLLPCRKRTQQFVATEKKATNVCWVICIPSFGQGDNPEGHFYSPCWEYLMIPR